jgi:hypothetical protein
MHITDTQCGGLHCQLIPSRNYLTKLNPSRNRSKYKITHLECDFEVVHASRWKKQLFSKRLKAGVTIYMEFIVDCEEIE